MLMEDFLLVQLVWDEVASIFRVLRGYDPRVHALLYEHNLWKTNHYDNT